MTKPTILDASALLALLNEEPGYKEVEPLLPDVMMSTVNISEVLAVLTEIGMRQKEAEKIVFEIIDQIIPFDVEQASIAASLRKYTKSCGLSFGDRACLSLAKAQKLTVVTADRVWGKLQIEDVKVNVIR